MRTRLLAVLSLTLPLAVAGIARGDDDDKPKGCVGGPAKAEPRNSKGDVVKMDDEDRPNGCVGGPAKAERRNARGDTVKMTDSEDRPKGCVGGPAKAERRNARGDTVKMNDSEDRPNGCVGGPAKGEARNSKGDVVKGTCDSCSGKSCAACAGSLDGACSTCKDKMNPSVVYVLPVNDLDEAGNEGKVESALRKIDGVAWVHAAANVGSVVLTIEPNHDVKLSGIVDALKATGCELDERAALRGRFLASVTGEGCRKSLCASLATLDGARCSLDETKSLAVFLGKGTGVSLKMLREKMAERSFKLDDVVLSGKKVDATRAF